ncbi:hypothetical protein FOMPIDRAFT_1054861 [Fomitopsis schrenkii]|uniref:Uncharacterized protein n=1 Tax=Fomitopsis schrenkii TaxID=2126942 RepID=S8DMW5_FOMSC|nr:hypothetical protein FOMPIDRAFT_1054861 [Fomitopsis schrenkii]
MDGAAAVLGVHAKSIRRWCANYEAFGEVKLPDVHSGRLPLISRNMEKVLAEFYRVGPMPTSTRHSSPSHSQSRTTYISRCTPCERDEERRKQWREEIRADFTAEQLVFGDQVSIDKRNLQQNSLAM